MSSFRHDVGDQIGRAAKESHITTIRRNQRQARTTVAAVIAESTLAEQSDFACLQIFQKNIGVVAVGIVGDQVIGPTGERQPAAIGAQRRERRVSVARVQAIRGNCHGLKAAACRQIIVQNDE